MIKVAYLLIVIGLNTLIVRKHNIEKLLRDSGKDLGSPKRGKKYKVAVVLGILSAFKG
jgi:hypothetical protein